MKLFNCLFVLSIAFVYLVSSCKKADTVKSPEETVVVKDGALNNLVFENAIKSLSGGMLLDSVSIRKAIPKEIAGLSLVSLKWTKGDNLTFTTSTTNLEYKDGFKNLFVSIVDIGNDSLNMVKLTPWTRMEFENKRDNGYEKVANYNGNMSFLKYDDSLKSSDLTVIYDNRFLLNLVSTSLSMDDLLAITK